MGSVASVKFEACCCLSIVIVAGLALGILKGTHFKAIKQRHHVFLVLKNTLKQFWGI